jgi:hypothetical protein
LPFGRFRVLQADKRVAFVVGSIHHDERTRVMAESKTNKPPVPPLTPHRSVGDTGTPQRGHEFSDDAKEAVESGEQHETGRSHGRIIGDDGEPLGKTDDEDHADKDEHWESGRHHAE